MEDLLWLVREHLGEDAELLERDSGRLGPGKAAGALLGGGLHPEEVERAVKRTRARVVHAHNLNPTFGWRALAAARAAGARVVAHLHQYRLVCAVGMCYTHGQDCTRCHGRNTVPGVVHRCRGAAGESIVYARRAVALATPRGRAGRRVHRAQPLRGRPAAEPSARQIGEPHSRPARDPAARSRRGDGRGETPRTPGRAAGPREGRRYGDRRPAGWPGSRWSSPGTGRSARGSPGPLPRCGLVGRVGRLRACAAASRSRRGARAISVGRDLRTRRRGGDGRGRAGRRLADRGAARAGAGRLAGAARRCRPRSPR